MMAHMNDEIDTLAQILWDYNVLNHKLTRSDAIIALGSMDVRTAERAAELWHQGLTPTVVVAGGFGRLTKHSSEQSEAELFHQVLRNKAVPDRAILVENRSTNTAENFHFSFDLLRAHNIAPQKIIVVTKPYMERRAYATCKKLYPAIDVAFSSPQISREQYPNDVISKGLMINILVGDTQRVLLYPAKGFTIPQDMPDEVRHAMDRLIAMGYDKQLIT